MTDSGKILTVKKLFKRPLFDLGEKNPEMAGIYSPHYTEKEMGRFMTGHYRSLKRSRDQANSWDMTNFYQEKIDSALQLAKFNHRQKNLTIFDVGCGFGSTTFPLLKMFPRSQIIASDFSIPMLLILKEKLAEQKLSKRCDIVQLNAESLDFKPNSFDVVVGGAILHHLFHPEKTIASCARILKPGGVAIFFEPFEEGNKLMRLMYKAIIYDRRSKWLPLYNQLLLRVFVSRWEKMSNQDKSSRFFKKVDDKWLFSRAYFQKLATKNSFKECLVFRTDGSETPYTSLLRNHLAGRTDKTPKWVFNIMQEYGDNLPASVKDELLFEGCAILKKQ